MSNVVGFGVDAGLGSACQHAAADLRKHELKLEALRNRADATAIALHAHRGGGLRNGRRRLTGGLHGGHAGAPRWGKKGSPQGPPSSPPLQIFLLHVEVAPDDVGPIAGLDQFPNHGQHVEVAGGKAPPNATSTG